MGERFTSGIETSVTVSVQRPQLRVAAPSRPFWSSSSASTSVAATATELGSNSVPHVSDTLLPIILAVVLASNATDDDEANANERVPWSVETTLKGQGAFASRQISRGELIVSERPVCIWPQGLSQQQAKDLFDKMDAQSQKAYMALSRDDAIAKELDDIRAVRATNGFAVQLPLGLGTAAMVFPKIARHVQPQLAMNFASLRMEAYAIADIAPKDELCIEYLPLICQTREERQKSLRDSFGFPQCLCPVCTASPDEVAKSDSRRREIKAIGETLKDGRRDRSGTIVKMERVRVLLEQEGYKGLPEFEDTSVSNAYAVYASMHARRQKEVQQ
ncbi:hypothetical protein OIO90_002801 [Microbotryomycetes sp. JL221]|nr:hypothetical protein OIO90_002801 [Microbotryomycetes sp. JL221]